MNSVPVTLTAGNVLTVAGNAVATTNSFGNIGFNGNTIYDINGISLQNSDLTHGYTAGVLLPTNGDANAIVVNNTYGNVILQSGSNSDPTATWTFRNTGNVSLPGGGLLGNTYGDNPNAVGLQAGPGGYAGINSYDQGQFVQTDGNGVYIGTDYTGNSCIWTFDASGNITLPGNASSINYANGDPYGGTSGNPFNQNLNTGNSVTFAGVSATGNINSGNIHTGQISATGNIITANGNISGANYVSGNFFVGDGGGLSNISVTANTGNISFDNSTVVGPSFGVAPGANSSVYIQPTVDSATRYQFSVGNLVAPGNINATGNVTAGKFIGNGASATLVAGSYNYVFDNGGILTLPAPPAGNEGAEIDFTKAGNSTLSGSAVVFDQYVDRFRFFESGGTNRGAYIDLTQAAAGVGTLLNNRVSGFVNAGTFVTMDNIKATVTTSGQRGLSLATVSGTATCYISGTYGMYGGATVGGSSAGVALTTTASSSIFSWSFGSEGDTATYVLNYGYTKAYRITMMIGGAYNNNMISIERLV